MKNKCFNILFSVSLLLNVLLFFMIFNLNNKVEEVNNEIDIMKKVIDKQSDVVINLQNDYFELITEIEEENNIKKDK